MRARRVCGIRTQLASSGSPGTVVWDIHLAVEVSQDTSGYRRRQGGSSTDLKAPPPLLILHLTVSVCCQRPCLNRDMQMNSPPRYRIPKRKEAPFIGPPREMRSSYCGPVKPSVLVLVRSAAQGRCESGGAETSASPSRRGSNMVGEKVRRTAHARIASERWIVEERQGRVGSSVSSHCPLVLLQARR